LINGDKLFIDGFIGEVLSVLLDVYTSAILRSSYIALISFV